VSPVPELTRFQRRQILTACVTYFAFHTVMSGIPVGSMGYFLSQKLSDGLTIADVAIGIATLNGVIISTRWATGVAAPYFGYLGDRHGREGVVLVAIPICLVSLMLLAFPASLLATVLFLPLAFAATGVDHGAGRNGRSSGLSEPSGNGHEYVRDIAGCRLGHRPAGRLRGAGIHVVDAGVHRRGSLDGGSVGGVRMRVRSEWETVRGGGAICESLTCIPASPKMSSAC